MKREDFINRSNRVHNHKFSYPEFDNYSSSFIKVPIICPEHGLFEQNPFDHVKGIGCSRCHFDSLKKWSEEEDELLKSKYKINKAKWCAKKLNKTEHAVRGRAQILGLSRKQQILHPQIPQSIWNSMIARSKSDGFQDSSIDFDSYYLWELYENQNGKCALSGWDIIFSKEGLKNTASIDRIDSNRGYFKDNIQLTHKIVNRCKLNLPEKLFFQLCKSVYLQKRDICDKRSLNWEEDIWNDTEYPKMDEYKFSDDFVLKDSKIINIRDL